MDSTANPAIEIVDLGFAYSRVPNGPLLRIDDWSVGRGQQVFLHGPSGSGKTTLLSLLSGMLIAQSGVLRILNQTLSDLSPGRRDRFRANHIGFIHQQFNLIPYLSVLDNLKLATHFSAEPPKTDNLHEHMKTLLQSLSLPANLLQRKAALLSVGQQQRVAIARALMNSPEIIIADEPTSALDADSKASFISLLREMVIGTSSTLVFVSHDHALAEHFDEVVDLRELNSVEPSPLC